MTRLIVGLDLLAYDFDGYYPPVANPPAINAAKAGSVVPLRFSLGGDFGLDVLCGRRRRSSAAGDWPLGTSTDASTPGKAGLRLESLYDSGLRRPSPCPGLTTLGPPRNTDITMGLTVTA